MRVLASPTFEQVPPLPPTSRGAGSSVAPGGAERTLSLAFGTGWSSAPTTLTVTGTAHAGTVAVAAKTKKAGRNVSWKQKITAASLVGVPGFGYRGGPGRARITAFGKEPKTT